MKKKALIFGLIAVLILALVLVACNKPQADQPTEPDQTQAATSTPEPEQTPEPSETPEPEQTTEPEQTPEPASADTVEPQTEPAADSEPEQTTKPTTTPEPAQTAQGGGGGGTQQSSQIGGQSQEDQSGADTEAADYGLSAMLQYAAEHQGTFDPNDLRPGAYVDETGNIHDPNSAVSMH